MKKLRLDRWGSERLLPTIGLAASFVSVAALLFAFFTPTLQQAERVQLHQPFDPESAVDLGSENSMMYAPDPKAITPTNVTDDWEESNAWGGVSDKTPLVTFTNTLPHKHPIQMWVINNWSGYDDTPNGGYLGNALDAQLMTDDDFLMFKMVWGIMDTTRHYAGIAYDVIEANYDPVHGYSTSWIELNTGYEVYVNTGNGNFSHNLRSNNFNVSIGYPLNESIEDVSPWTIIGQILTFSLPGTDTVVDILIAVPFYLIIGFVVLMIASRFIPTVGGG